jgi:hypothetical protein
MDRSKTIRGNAVIAAQASRMPQTARRKRFESR